MHTPVSSASPNFIVMLLSALALALALGLAMVSPQSLWIDELQTLSVAEVDSLTDCVARMSSSGNSEAQMVGYVGYVWAWEKVLGQSEWALRLSNMPWLLLSVAAIAGVAKRLKNPWLTPALLVQPFLWFYVDELRPYAMQIAGGSVALWAMTEYVWRRGLGTSWAWGLVAAALIVSLASMLGALTVASLIVVLLVLGIRSGWSPDPRAIATLLFGAVLLGCLGAYYAWTLSRGAGGATHWSVSPANIAFAVYEFLGFSGFGLPRDAMRESAQSGLGVLFKAMEPYLLGLVLLGLGYAWLLLGALFTRPKTVANRHAVSTPDEDGALLAKLALAMLVLNLVLLLGLAVVAKWPFWGRHLAPVFPCWVYLLAWMIHRYSSRGWGRVLGVALLGMLLVSSLALRFSPDHAKDDYRGAAALAREAVDDGQPVWWVASDLKNTALYGGYLRANASDSQYAYLFDPTPEELAGVPRPNVVFLSKPDIHDPDGLVREYLEENGFEVQERLKAFDVWRRPLAGTTRQQSR